MVYYRKYRPQKIEELDNEEVRNKLYSVFSKKSHSHAFLFTGPKGLGKTSTARIIAKVINCERLVDKRLASSSKEKKLNANNSTLNTSVEPCNKCEQCVSITNGTNLDVLEIDAASNRGIDEIRDLREKIRLSPLSAAKKIYIIDEVHMLTTEAFNALLKTLEEPPSHAVFILCTTEPQKIPATILSRCFHIPFSLAKKEELMRSFKRIVKNEKLSFEEEALDLIASLADGSFRDGTKILEELVLVSNGQKITREMVEEKYQISNIKNHIGQMLEFLADKNIKKALGLVQELVGQGTEMKYFLEQMINELHAMLLIKTGIETRNSDLRPELRSREFRIQNSEFDIDKIKKLIILLVKAHGEMKYAVLPQLPLEMVIIEWGQAQKDTDVSVISSRSLASLSASDRPSRDGRRSGSVVGSKFVSPQVVGSQADELRTDNDKEEKVSQDNSQIWEKLINAVKTHNHSVAGVLRGCTLKNYDQKKLVIETKYKFHKEKLEEPKVMGIIEKAVVGLSGKTVDISVVLKEK